MPNVPIDVAIGIVRHQGKILICRRSAAGTFAGVWEFPGGKCEADEAPASALHRELIEELGVSVEVDRALPVIEHDYPAFSVRLHPFICTLVEGDPRALTADRLLWIEPAELRDYSFPPANAALIEQVARTLAAPGIIQP